jgi:shikimate dehydrogenase
VLGSPIAHSLSPVLHTAAYAARGLGDWAYEAIECDEARLPGLLGSLGPGWSGLSLTMPLKRAVLPLLDQAEPLVGEVGGANTVIFREGRRLGFNTDVPGMIAALAEAGVAAVPDALILGAGATACAALAALRGLGARQVTVAVRRPATAGPLLDVAARLGLAARLVPFGDDDAEPARHLLLSTVPAAAAVGYAERITSGQLAPAAIMDVIYYPWPTALAAAAQTAGLPVASGFGLLLHQAVGQFELMTGQDAPVEAMRAAGQAALAARHPAPDPPRP